MSPRPKQMFGTVVSRMVRESTFEKRDKKCAKEKFALIKPVITSTDGRWVASTR